jgi:hypothetical protein
MKRFLNSCVLVLTAILSTASMCEDEGDKNDDYDNKAIETSLGQGSCKITYFFDNADETIDFEGYSFLFNDDNVAIATRNSLSVQGSWDTEHKDDGDTKLYLDFGTIGPLEELNEDWLVIEYSSIKINLEHKSDGDGDTDTLIFERR